MDSGEYRARARELREVAETTYDPSALADLLVLAGRYDWSMTRTAACRFSERCLPICRCARREADDLTLTARRLSHLIAPGEQIGQPGFSV